MASDFDHVKVRKAANADYRKFLGEHVQGGGGGVGG
jgi:hypothetical protein